MQLEFYDSSGKSRGTSVAARGEKLSEAIWLSPGIAKQSLCAGLARCGRCKARFITMPPEVTEREKTFFSADELAAGWRLTCQHRATESENQVIALELPDAVFASENETFLPDFPPFAEKQIATLGVDLGTTSIAWETDFADISLASIKGEIANPQCAAGADVVSRILLAISGKENLLASLVKNWLQTLLSALTSKNIKVNTACIAGNSAMTLIFCEKDLSGVASAPYSLPWKGNAVIKLNALNCEIIIPPLPAPFVGGDISAGLLALLEEKKEPPFIMADLGTNGEIVLFINPETVFFASVPMGPAMEGIGPAMGSLPGKDVATDFRITPAGIMPVDMDNHIITIAKGISATGYLSLLGNLLKLGIIDRNGKFVHSTQFSFPLTIKICQGFDTQKNELHLPNGIHISGDDMEILLMVKAAFSVALKILLKTAGVRPEKITKIYLAGALGQYVNYQNLFDLGFFPPVLNNKLEAVGNTSLRGACILAKKPAELDKIAKICDNAITLDLANNPEFQTEYIKCLNWDWS